MIRENPEILLEVSLKISIAGADTRVLRTIGISYQAALCENLQITLFSASFALTCPSHFQYNSRPEMTRKKLEKRDKKPKTNWKTYKYEMSKTSYIMFIMRYSLTHYIIIRFYLKN